MKVEYLCWIYCQFQSFLIFRAVPLEIHWFHKFFDNKIYLIPVSKPIKTSEINIKVPNSFIIQLSAVSIDWAKMIDFLSEGRQDIFNYCKIPSKLYRNSHK